MDKLTKCVLGLVNREAGGAYKVLEAEDFLAALPEGEQSDADGIGSALHYLAERGYVDMKYSDRGTFCVRSLPKGRSYTEEEAAPAAAAAPARVRGKGGFLAFRGAFLGAFLGSGAAVALLTLLG